MSVDNSETGNIPPNEELMARGWGDQLLSRGVNKKSDKQKRGTCFYNPSSKPLPWWDRLLLFSPGWGNPQKGPFLHPVPLHAEEK